MTYKTGSNNTITDRGSVEANTIVHYGQEYYYGYSAESNIWQIGGFKPVYQAPWPYSPASATGANGVASFPVTNPFGTQTLYPGLSSLQYYGNGTAHSPTTFFFWGKERNPFAPPDDYPNGHIKYFPYSNPSFGWHAISGYVESQPVYATPGSPTNFNGGSDDYTGASYTHGYHLNGDSWVATRSSRFPLYAPFTMTEYTGPGLPYHQQGTAMSAINYGYVYCAGGQGPPGGGSQILSTIWRFPTAGAPMTVSSFGDLTTPSWYCRGTQSTEYGYKVSGTNPSTSPAPNLPNPSLYFSDLVERFPFSSPFTTATDVGSIGQNYYGSSVGAGVAHGFVTGGSDTTPAPGPIQTDAVIKFPFSAPFISVNDVGNLYAAMIQHTSSED